jgi:hypothetical protein
MNEEPEAVGTTPDSAPEILDAPNDASSNVTDAAPTLARGSTSVVLVVGLALSIVFLFALVSLMGSPAGGCGGG